MFKDVDAVTPGGEPTLTGGQDERMRVLIVDDDPAFRAVLADISKALGYEVAEAENGRQALSLLGNAHTDFMILDIFMPDQDGMETMQLLRRRSPRPRVIAMSGAFSGHFLTAAKVLGADATLMKPFTVSSLVEAFDIVRSKM